MVVSEGHPICVAHPGATRHNMQSLQFIPLGEALVPRNFSFTRQFLRWVEHLVILNPVEFWLSIMPLDFIEGLKVVMPKGRLRNIEDNTDLTNK